MSKKECLIFLSSVLILFCLTTAWWFFIKGPLVQSTEITRKKMVADQKYIDQIKKIPSSNQEFFEKDLISPAGMSLILVKAFPKKDFILNHLKKEKTSNWSSVFKNEYELEGVSTYEQFLVLLSAIKQEKGIFFESIAFYGDSYPKGKFLIHMYAYSRVKS